MLGKMKIDLPDPHKGKNRLVEILVPWKLNPWPLINELDKFTKVVLFWNSKKKKIKLLKLHKNICILFNFFCLYNNIYIHT
jgi:hypothetical protein